MSRVLVDQLNIRTGSTFINEKVGQFNRVQMINNGEELIFSEWRILVRFKDEEGNLRYVCTFDNEHQVYVYVPLNIPGPHQIPFKYAPSIIGLLSLIPKQSQFPDERIQKMELVFYVPVLKGD